MTIEVPKRLAVTGIIHQVKGSLNLKIPEEEEEAKRLAREFARAVPMGTRYRLQLNPENPADPLAVKVYTTELPGKQEMVGYLAARHARLQEALPFKGGRAEAIVRGWDGNRTLFVEVPGARPTLEVPDDGDKATLPPLPFIGRCPYLEDDNTFIACYGQFLEIPLAEEHLKEWIAGAKSLVDEYSPTLCKPYMQAMTHLEGLMGRAEELLAGRPPSDGMLKNVKQLWKNHNDRMSDIITASTDNYLGVLRENLDRLREEASRSGGVLEKYRERYLYDEATRPAVMREHLGQLAGWFAALPMPLPARHGQLKPTHAQDIGYGDLSRADLYRLLYGWLLMEWLERELAESPDPVAERADAVFERIRERLLPIFYGNEAEARRFIRRVSLMTKSVQVTNLVKECVKNGIINEEDAHRYLWAPLYEEGLYKAGESNWNQRLND